MLSLKRIRWPQFSLIGLFWFATAVTLGFSIGKTSIEEPVNTLFGMQARALYSPTLIAIGAVLVVYELVRQATLLCRSNAELQVAQQTRWLAIGVRGGLAIGIALALACTQLINRQIIVLEEPSDFLQFYGELWPATILLLLLFVSMRLMTSYKQLPHSSSLMQLMATLIVGFGMVMMFVYMITDRNAINFLVHVAIANIEKDHAMRWQRLNAFPDQIAEDFLTFWIALRAAILVAIGGLCLVFAANASRKTIAVLLGLLFVLTVVHGVRHAHWFVTEEFPRINPDLASQELHGLTSQWPGALALGVGLSLVLGDRLAAAMRNEQRPLTRSSIQLPEVSGLMVIGALLVAMGCGSDFLRTWYDSMGMPAGWYTDTPWLDHIASFVSLLTYPEQMIPLGATIAGLRIVWQYYHPSGEQTRLQPRSLPRVLAYSAAVLLWLVVAVPTFAIFGFCYWLGPWVL
ncbi:MAG: hypothetical protein AAGD11_03625 [Planctomycetota bacterium]